MQSLKHWPSQRDLLSNQLQPPGYLTYHLPALILHVNQLDQMNACLHLWASPWWQNSCSGNNNRIKAIRGFTIICVVCHQKLKKLREKVIWLTQGEAENMSLRKWNNVENMLRSSKWNLLVLPLHFPLKRSCTPTLTDTQKVKSVSNLPQPSAQHFSDSWRGIIYDEKQSTLSTCCHNTLRNRHRFQRTVCHCECATEWISSWRSLLLRTPSPHPQGPLSLQKHPTGRRSLMEWAPLGIVAPRQLAVWKKARSEGTGVGGGGGDGVWHSEQS